MCIHANKFTFSFQNRELVRQKAVLCLHRFQLLAPDLLAHVQADLEQMLFDKDPGVMAAALNIVSHNIQVNHYYPYTISIIYVQVRQRFLALGLLGARARYSSLITFVS